MAVVRAQSAVVCVPAGQLRRGRTHSPRADERPAHTVDVEAFCIDETLVTREQFASFVEATGYRTDAERMGVGFESIESMDDWEWRRVVRGSWRRPFSVEDDDTRAFLRPDAPVVMVSWRDSAAYCAWRRGRLPTEVEWEYAMRAGSSGTRFPWGDAPTDERGRYRCNYWQGASHHRNERSDGFVYVSPVRAFAPNAWGIYDPAGNVWQWTADVYLFDSYSRAARHDDAAVDEGARAKRVLRGGSWWCASCTCEGYGLWYRGRNDERAAFSNNGFRCVYAGRDARAATPVRVPSFSPSTL